MWPNREVQLLVYLTWEMAEMQKVELLSLTVISDSHFVVDGLELK
jgi:hypothetical protein